MTPRLARGSMVTEWFATVKVRPFDNPLPGLKTVTVKVPATSLSLGSRSITSWFGLIYPVVLSEPLIRATDVGIKPDPLMRISVWEKLEAGGSINTVFGDNEDKTGVVLLIVSVCAADVPPPGPGLKTVMLAVPPSEISAAEIIAVTCPELTNVVVRSEPLKRTTELALKLEPFA